MIIILISIRIVNKVNLENKRSVNFMYVCVCKAVTENDIRKAVKDGANCMRHLENRFGVGSECGACHSEASACLERSIEKEMRSTGLIANL